jgi:hypothetical protein
MSKKKMKKQIEALEAVVLQHEDKIYALEYALDFYSGSLNNLEMLVKRISETQYIMPQTISTKPWQIFNRSK